MFIKLKIARITIGYTYHFNHYFKDHLSAYQIDDCSNIDYHMEVILTHDIPTYDLPFIVKDNESYYTTDDLDITTYTMQNQKEIIEQLVFDKKRREVKMYINPKRVKDLPMKEYILSGIMFIEIALHEGYLALHASAIDYQGDAILFSAPSTTGKSTHARMWKELYLDDVYFINDDKPLIYEERGKLFVTGSPFSGKRVLNQNVVKPLKSIIFLSQSKIDQVSLLHQKESLKNLMINMLRPKDEKTWDILIKTLNHITDQIPIYQLGATMSYDAVKLVHKTLYEEKTNES
jgi:hypothetical protein